MLSEDTTRVGSAPEPSLPAIEKRIGDRLFPGEILAKRYRIESLIDGGGMGDVYRAHDDRLGCAVALKRIKPDLLRDPQFRQRVALEIYASAVINHPGIARATDSHDDGDDMVFIVYELVEGNTLHTLLGERRFGLGEILGIGIEACEALAAAHAKGFIHRDLKPKNIMLVPQQDGPSHIKILDFGLAKKVKVFSPAAPAAGGGSTFIDLTGKSAAMILGTADYMSPEQATPEPLDSRTDIYSLGLTLYEMTAGFNPFAGGNADSARRRVLSMKAPPLPQIESGDREYLELDRILRKCLSKRPEARYPSVSELLADLKALRGFPARATTDARDDLISRRLACALFTLIQVGYLAMYAAAFNYLPDNVHRIPLVFQRMLQPVGAATFVEATLVMLCGAAAVRLYLLAAVAYDYRDLGRLFYQVLPLIVLIDLVWALSPFLLFHKFGFITLLAVPCLAFLPFSQRTLVFNAYARRGGRSSAARASQRVPPRGDIPEVPKY